MSFKLSGLGKGLDEILTENITSGSLTEYVKISSIEPNKNQPRKNFSPEDLKNLASSIEQYGILQPLLVKPIAGTNSYQIIAGERRWRAARIAGKTEIPVVIKELTDREQAEIALIENLQREDLSPLEEAAGYKSLLCSYNLTQEEIAKSVGKSRSAVTNALRLLSLPKKVKDSLINNEITVGHAKALLSLKNEEEMLKVCEIAIAKGLSVRELENLCKKVNEPSKKENCKKIKNKDSFLEDVEVSLNKALGRKVSVVSKSASKGVLQLEFYGKEDLLDLVKFFGCW